MRGLIRLLLLLGTWQQVFADSLDGEYHATLDGQAAELHLRSQDSAVEGLYIENHSLRLKLRGRFDGRLLSAEILDPSGQVLATLSAAYADNGLNTRVAARDPRSGQVIERQALFQRRGASAADPRPSGEAGPLDPALIGTWQHENLINSGGADFASFTTLLTLQLGADGNVTQWSRSVGGGGDWSFDSPGELQYSGRWYSDNGALMVQLQGNGSYQPAGRYRFSEQYLVIEGSNGRMIWKRP
ncbi:MAG: hypothetical protein V4812_10475 [Pseudomonadota bacterium]